MDEKGRSTLCGKILRFVGFVFTKHPVKEDFYLMVSIYCLNKRNQEWVFCTSEGPGKGNSELAEMGLGGMVPGEVIAPYSQRYLQGSDYYPLKKFLTKKIPGNWHWYK